MIDKDFRAVGPSQSKHLHQATLNDCTNAQRNPLCKYMVTLVTFEAAGTEGLSKTPTDLLSSQGNVQDLQEHLATLTLDKESDRETTKLVQKLISQMINSATERFIFSTTFSSHTESQDSLFVKEEVPKGRSALYKTKNCKSALSRLMPRATPQKRRKTTFLPRIAEGDPNFLRLKVYFFGTPQFTFLSVSKEHKVEQLLAHVVSLADVDPNVGECFNNGLPKQVKEGSKDPELYELRFIDENGSKPYVPLYRGDPLNKESPIGDFSINSVVFCKTKEYEDLIYFAKASTSSLSQIELGLELEDKGKEEEVLGFSPHHRVPSASP
eukprot:TRINITY_DN4355_c0_g1_i10.p1 TRINITY_DN4355_c0_g1~~TRINITY_DN4355_c0_g1_i10.p1  ORF type:complete len:325 (-),score=30.65 TRINITY_DN4355_c0_g1_i10:1041-2015(-)